MKRNELERESMKDYAESRQTKASSIFAWVLGIGVLLMMAAYLGGFLTTGSPNAEKSMGAITTADSAAVSESDTIVGK